MVFCVLPTLSLAMCSPVIILCHLCRPMNAVMVDQVLNYSCVSVFAGSDLQKKCEIWGLGTSGYIKTIQFYSYLPLHICY